MAPFTPFLTEAMYQNLSKCLPKDQAPPSVHFCPFPAQMEAQEGDERIQQSVDRMQNVIELARTIRERRNKPLKFPLKSLVVSGKRRRRRRGEAIVHLHSCILFISLPSTILLAGCLIE